MGCHVSQVEPLRSRHSSFALVQVLAYHEAIRDEVRSANLDTFLRPVRRRSGAAAGEADAEVPIVMVATDRMSRGM